MESKKIISDDEIRRNLISAGYTFNADNYCVDEGRLILTELLTKASAGYALGHTENNYLRLFCLLKKDRTPKKLGRMFLCAMISSTSNRKPEIHNLIKKFRK